MKIKTNSKYVKKDDIFICIHDEFEDRHKYIDDIKNASAIIVDKDITKKSEIPLIKVNDTNNTLFEIYNNYYEKPLDNLSIIGVTGTDGKTTTSLVLKEILSNFKNTAYLGTNGFHYNDKKIKTKNTTPSIDTFLKYANFLNKDDITSLVMEVSSEGLLHNRCNNLRFKRAIITNVTGDHLNIHKTFDNYLKSKLRLFSLLDYDGIAIINTDDISYDYIKEMDINIISYGTNKNADYQILEIKELENKTIFKLKHKDKIFEIKSPLLGKFNVYNLTAVISCLGSLGISIDEIKDYIPSITQISGRMNIFYSKKGAQIILDYAHTLKSTTEILTFANKIKKGKIITVVGSAGGRETEKRKDIGKIVTDLSDEVIFTMDDPRYEKVKDIIDELTKTSTKNNYISIINRKKAIKHAIKIGKKDDIILILGKGTDTYMAVKDKYKKYSDLKIIKKYI